MQRIEPFQFSRVLARPDSVEPETTYLAHRALIDKTVAWVCGRQRLSAADAEDFAGTLHQHLIENDYAVLRKFEGRSSLQTYLCVVVTHLFQDWRNKRWGKWRPSAEARRQGPVAVHLERFLVRDGLSFDEAFETLRTTFRITESRSALEAIAQRFPARTSRQFVSERTLDEYAAPDSRADAPLRDLEAADAARRASGLLRQAFMAMPPQDRLILKMRFDDDISTADIARALNLDPKPLYRRIDRLLAWLRAALEDAGIDAATAAEILERHSFDRLVTPMENGEASPSSVERLEPAGPGTGGKP
jgi:RNA polymerase sigma factor (sigma-70 family)